ncbi:hypothetical protein Ancab_002958 [Ancistrocladus abbreviatus]
MSSRGLLQSLHARVSVRSEVAIARPLNSRSALLTRLKLDHGSTDCWGSLFQLQSCTGEVIQFFYDGATYLGPDCCRAIRIIERNCWPAMLTSLGFTPEEGAILLGYCDAEDSSATPSTQFPPPTLVASESSVIDAEQSINP